MSLRTTIVAVAAVVALAAIVGPLAPEPVTTWRTGPSGAEGPPTPEPRTLSAMRFGLDASGAMTLQGTPAAPEYGTLWVGPWTLTYGWAAVEREFDAMREAGVVPAVHLYYWGDDMSATCLSSGCQTASGRKDTASWERLAAGLADRLAEDDEALIFLETEFNKAQVATHEPLDEALARVADLIHARAPDAAVVLGLGNWYAPAWPTWDRAAEASDYVGVQALRASTRNGLDGLNVSRQTLDGAREASDLFGKPVIVHDVAIASYPDDEGLVPQGTAMIDLFDGLLAWREAGVEAVIYRSLRDTSNANTAEYFGEAERHWGLAFSDGRLKPAGEVWMAGVEAERMDAAAAHLAEPPAPADP